MFRATLSYQQLPCQPENSRFRYFLDNEMAKNVFFCAASDKNCHPSEQSLSFVMGAD
jgi:hypothetical protein